MRLLFILAGAVVCGFAQTEDFSPRLHAVGDIAIGQKFQSVPRWSGGALVSVENSHSVLPVVRIFDSQGRQAAVVPVKIPGASYLEVRRAAHAIDGRLAICGSSMDPEGHVAGFLALASADGKIHTVVRTEPYVPTAVVFAIDGTIWTRGAEFDRTRQAPSKTDNGILRHFDDAGNLLAKYLPQASLSHAELFLGLDQLAANAKRVGWYQGTGATAYFEVAADRLERYPVVDTVNNSGHPEISGLSITDDDRVFVTKSVSGDNPELYMLDRESRSWRRVAVPAGGSPAATSWLLGGNGNILVFKTTEQSQRLRRFEIRAN